MRRLLGLLLPIAVVALLAGCGSSSSSGGTTANSALATELSYFPANSPFVVTLQTDPNSTAIKQAHQFEGHFPIASFGQAALTSRLQALGLNYDRDIRPLFGHPVALGAPSARIAGATKNDFLIVWQAADAGTLNTLLKKLGVANAVGARDGAKLYGAGSTSLAVAGSTLVFGPTPAIITAALDRHAHGAGITNDQFRHETAGLDPSSLVEIFGDLSGELSQPSAATARQIPWVAALRGYGVAGSVGANGVSLKFHLDTTGRSLTTSQLPFSSGSAAPSLPGTGPVAAGIHDPAQIVSFAEAAAQQTNDSGFFKFLDRQAQLKAKTGTNLNALLGQLTGELLVSSDTHTTLVRAAVSDAATVRSDLAKLASDPRDVLSRPGESVHRLAGGFYAIVEPNHTLIVGLVGRELVGGNATPARLRAFATAPTTAAPGAQGTTAFRVSLPELLQLTLRHGVPAVAQQVLRQLGDITGWASSSPSGITGSASLAIR